MTSAPLALLVLLAQARDVPLVTTGTASIVGTVASDDPQQPLPLRRAFVTLNSTDPVVGRTAVTDDQGRFAFVNLPAGRYSLSATKRGWPTLAYGAKLPGRQGRSIPLAPGERATASFRLPRPAVITGTILDENGLPPNGVLLRVMRYAFTPGSGDKRMTNFGASYSGPDDRGQYRVWGLPPGEYYISVTSQTPFLSAGSDLHLTTDVDVQEAVNAVAAGPAAPIADVPQRNVGFSAVFYPGATSPAQATPIVVRAGEERTGVDVTVQYSPTARLDGSLSMPGGGSLPPNTRITLVTNDPSGPLTAIGGVRYALLGPNGRFEFAQLPPGPYLLAATVTLAPPEGSTTPQVLSASMDVDMQSEDQHGVSLLLQDTLTISGVVRWEGDGPPPSLAGFRPGLQIVAAGAAVTSGGGTTAANGTFTMPGVTPGRYRLSIGGPQPSNWTLRAVTAGGQNVLDLPFDVRQSLADVTFTLTDRVSELSGKTDPAAADSTIVLFPQNRDLWYAQSRRVLTTRPAKDGSYSFKRVPPGDYSLAAVDDVEPGEWYDPAFLQRLMPAAIKVTIGEGEKKTQDIHIGG
jgi:hypothetical protein